MTARAHTFLEGGRVRVADVGGLRIPSGKPPFALGDALIILKVSPTGALVVRPAKPGSLPCPGLYRPNRFEPHPET